LACRSEWIVDPPFPESAGKGLTRDLEVRLGARLAEASGSSIHPSQRTQGRAQQQGNNGSVQARRSEWIVDPPFPESTGKGLTRDLDARLVFRLAEASGSSIHPSQQTQGRAQQQRNNGSVQARRSEWIIDPPFPESTGKGLTRDLDAGLVFRLTIVDLPFAESARKGWLIGERGLEWGGCNVPFPRHEWLLWTLWMGIRFK